MIGGVTRPRRLAGVTTPFATVAFAILTLAVLAGLAMLMIWQNYRTAVESGEARALSSAQVVAAHIEWMMEASDQALRRIDAALSNYPVSTSADSIADIRKAVGDLPEGFQYSVYDETGHLRYSSVPEAIGIQVSDREYFKRIRDGEQVVVSPQLKERLSDEQVFVVARRISRGGRFNGAASIAIPTTAMDEFWMLLELGPHSTVSVVREDGWLVARHPQLPETINLNSSPLFNDYLPKAPSGFYHNAASVADGVSRIVGYRKVDLWPLVAITGIERGEALQFFWGSLRDGLLIGVPVIILLAGGMFWILRLLRGDAARRLALEQALERNNFLMREIHHRVKNNLQAVSSLVRLQPLPQDRKDDLSARIAAMVAVHEHIYGSDQFEEVEVASYIGRIVKDSAEGFRGHVTIETQIEPLRLGSARAMPLGLLVNELVTNAFKHAWVNRIDGRLAVRLTVLNGKAELIVEDDGLGYSHDRRTGMGSRLIEGFVMQLGGTIKVDVSAGTRVIVSFLVH